MNSQPSKMLCLVKQPNSLCTEIELDSKSAVGQDCLEKILSHLGIIESDYFGLQYSASKGEVLWLNLRNPICRQLGGTAPYRLQLRVKFFVQPHFLLQDSTRHQFFLNVKHDLISGDLHCPDTSQLVELVSLIAQAEFGDFCPQRAHLQLVQYGSLLPESHKQMETLSQVICQHEHQRGLSQKSAKYRAIQVASNFEDYGMELHHVVNLDSGAPSRMGVGPSGISIIADGSEVIEKIEFQGLQQATHDGRQLTLCLTCEDGSALNLTFRLCTQRAAIALYRCVTEMHSFYRCDTVRNAVASQVCRDLKGTLAALFNDSSTLGQKFVFDIQRTMREAHDHARRLLYSMQNDAEVHEEELTPDVTPEVEGASAEVMETDQGHSGCTSNQCQELRNAVSQLRDVFTCQICADGPLNTAFCPCGHVVCCNVCASRVDFCPMCRTPIERTQQIFLPSMQHCLLSDPVSPFSDTNVSRAIPGV